MRLRSIPPKTCITLAREGKLKSVARDWNIKPLTLYQRLSDTPQVGKRGRMRQQVSRKPFEEKLAKWQEELEELAQWSDEGFDVSKIKKSVEERIEGLLDLLEGENLRHSGGKR